MLCAVTFTLPLLCVSTVVSSFADVLISEFFMAIAIAAPMPCLFSLSIVARELSVVKSFVVLTACTSRFCAFISAPFSTFTFVSASVIEFSTIICTVGKSPFSAAILPAIDVGFLILIHCEFLDVAFRVTSPSALMLAPSLTFTFDTVFVPTE